MKKFSKLQAIIGYFAIFSMLFSQLAVAAYVCPITLMENQSSLNVQLTSIYQVSTSNCDEMDMQQPSLCYTHAHGEVAKKSLDKSALPPIQPFVPIQLALTLYLNEVDFYPTFTPRESLFLKRSTAPPVTIRHCCFRI